jgi:hypothetical protein
MVHIFSLIGELFRRALEGQDGGSNDRRNIVQQGALQRGGPSLAIAPSAPKCPALAAALLVSHEGRQL